MKRIIDIEQDYYEIIKYNIEQGQKYKPWEIIANSIPYEERPQGEWIARNDETHYCSNCRGDAIDGDFDEILTTFCPHCGAEMKGGAE